MKTTKILSIVVLGGSLQACSTISETWDSMWKDDKSEKQVRTTRPDPYFSSAAAPQANSYRYQQQSVAAATQVNPTARPDPYFSRPASTAPSAVQSSDIAPAHHLRYQQQAVVAPTANMSQNSGYAASYSETMDANTRRNLTDPHYGNTVGYRGMPVTRAPAPTPVAQPQSSYNYRAPVAPQAPAVQAAAPAPAPAYQQPVVQAPQPVQQQALRGTQPVSGMYPQQSTAKTYGYRQAAAAPQTTQTQAPAVSHQFQPVPAAPQAPVATAPVQATPVARPVATPPPARLPAATTGPGHLVMGLHTNAESGGWFSSGLTLHLVDQRDFEKTVELDFKGKDRLAIEEIPAGVYRINKLTLGSRKLPLGSNYITVQGGRNVYAGSIVVDVTETNDDGYTAKIATEDHYDYTRRYLSSQKMTLHEKQLFNVRASSGPQGARFQDSKGFFNSMFGG